MIQNKIIENILQNIIAQLMVIAIVAILGFWKRTFLRDSFKKIETWLVTKVKGEKITPLGHSTLPSRPEVIIGREDTFIALKDRLGITSKSNTEPQPVTTIVGWPGVGKTTVAAALAYDPDVTGKFKDGIFWADVGTDPDIFGELVKWGNCFGTEDIKYAPDLDQAVKRLKTIFHGKKVLLIVDDVWKEENGLPFRKSRGGCPIIFTTRSRGVARGLRYKPNGIYYLPGLSMDDSIKLFENFAPKVIKMYPEKCRKIIEELEGLPLAIRVAATMLQEEYEQGFMVDIETLLGEIKEGEALLKAKPSHSDFAREFIDDESEDKDVFSVATLLKKSVERLDESDRVYFALLGLFESKPATFDLEVMAKVWEVKDAKPIVKKLVDRGLLEPDGTGRYYMHALLSSLARSMIEGEE